MSQMENTDHCDGLVEEARMEYKIKAEIQRKMGQNVIQRSVRSKVEIPHDRWFFFREIGDYVLLCLVGFLNKIFMSNEIGFNVFK